MLTDVLRKLKSGTEYLNYGRDVITAMTAEYAAQSPDGKLRVLDVGLGTAADILNVQETLAPREVELYGLESYAPYVKAAREKKITVVSSNIEKDRFPFEDQYFDVVLANQVIEHTKEVFWIFSEVSRILKAGGVAIIGVPNLASLHNRIMLALGMQPSSIEMLGPHVRGITKGGFRRFITTDGYFELLKVRGSNFYPFPAAVARPLSRLLPAMSVSLFFLCRRTDRAGCFGDVLKTRFYETPFFAGE